jgi:NDP-sugar pyrophosphorylase family protein
MKAVILAAGKGKRMRHLTAYLPKPMLTIKGKPVLRFILDGLMGAGITEVCIVTGYLGETIEKYFGDGHSLNIRIQYRRQPSQDGTARSAEAARSVVGDEPFLLTFGDLFLDPENYKTITATFLREQPDGMIGVCPPDAGSDNAAVLFDGNERLHSFVDKTSSRAATIEWQDAGLYVMPPELFRFTSHTMKSPRGEYDLTDALEALVAAGQRIKGFQINSYCLDISTPESLKRAEMWV